ncbi:MAG: serine/threonine protein kinase, partial [Myxococcaceae bacterium]|nr:serine/threonine protein kinase [Myxococcaceae bacterium]
MARAESKGSWHLPIPVSVFIAAEMLKGLHHAHSRKGRDGRPLHLVHRDVTPDNVLLSFEGAVKVADFGIAKASLSGRQETQVGVVKGKYLYFSPEQATGKKVDARTDVYAVGVCLYQMLTGQRPYEGTLVKVMPKLVAGAYTPIRELNPEVPEALAAIVEAAMAKDLAHRYQSALQMLEALTAFLSENAPSFSGERVKLLLDSLYEKELAAAGMRPRFSEAERDQLAAWRPAGPPPRGAASSRGGGSSPLGLSPVADAPDGDARPLRVAAAALAVVMVLGGGVAAFLMLGPPPAESPDEGALTPLSVKPPAPLPPRARPGVDAAVAEMVERPGDPAPVPTAAASADDRRRAVKVLADTHLVSRQVASVHRKKLDGAPAWHVTLVVPGPLLGDVALELEDAAGAREQVPIRNGESVEVTGKRALGVRCDPGGRVTTDDAATLQFTAAGVRSMRLLVDPKRCHDYSQAKGLELDPDEAYQLSMPQTGQASLGAGAPVRVAWRARLRDGASSQGLLEAGQVASIVGASFLDLGFLDDTPSDNSGDVTLSLEPLAPQAAQAGGFISRVRGAKGPSALSYARSTALPTVQRANRLLGQGRFAEVPAVLAPCFDEPTPVPECYRLQGEALLKLDQRDLALQSYRSFLELAGSDHPSRAAIQRFVERASGP